MRQQFTLKFTINGGETLAYYLVKFLLACRDDGDVTEKDGTVPMMMTSTPINANALDSDELVFGVEVNREKYIIFFPFWYISLNSLSFFNDIFLLRITSQMTQPPSVSPTCPMLVVCLRMKTSLWSSPWTQGL